MTHRGNAVVRRVHDETAVEEDADQRWRVAVTLVDEAAKTARELSDALGIGAAEAVRRGLTLLALYVSLGPDEELVVRNKKDNSIERLYFGWDRLRSVR